MKIIALILLACLPIRAEDWIVEGKTYSNVKIVKIEADCVTILDADGGARLDLAKLPAELQKKLGYDADKAMSASEERKKDDAENAITMQKEAYYAENNKSKKLAAEQFNKDVEALRNKLVGFYVKIDGTVLQKCEGGYLITINGINGGPAFSLISDAPLFLASNRDLVDGDRVNENIYPIGINYSYIDTQGAQRTVREFAENIDSAVKVLIASY